jgi:macrodomain Ter protein organizer (MatP/YcbG family)
LYIQLKLQELYMAKFKSTIKAKKKKGFKASRKLTTKDFIRVFGIVLICTLLLLGIAARCIHFYKEHIK